MDSEYAVSVVALPQRDGQTKRLGRCSAVRKNLKPTWMRDTGKAIGDRRPKMSIPRMSLQNISIERTRIALGSRNLLIIRSSKKSNAGEARQILSKARNKEMDVETKRNADAYNEAHDRKKKIVIELTTNN